jgi:hypothetical protein
LRGYFVKKLLKKSIQNPCWAPPAFMAKISARTGMRGEYIEEQRGDSKKEAFDLYNHIDLKELKEAYLAAIPQLGI